MSLGTKVGTPVRARVLRLGVSTPLGLSSGKLVGLALSMPVGLSEGSLVGIEVEMMAGANVGIPPVP